MGPAAAGAAARNGSGADVLWTLTRFPGTPDEAWQAGLDSMRRELEHLKKTLESAA